MNGDALLLWPFGIIMLGRLSNMFNLNNDLKAAETNLITRRANRTSLQTLITNEDLNVIELKNNVQLISDGVLLMQRFAVGLRSDVITKFEDLLTKGVRQVFNVDYKISIEFTNSGNAVHADFMVKLPNSKKVNLATGEGGGLRDFVGILQRILYIILEPSLPAKVLFIDEGLKALDVDRSPEAFRFISQLTMELGIQVVFITHSQAAKTLSDTPGVMVLEVSHDGAQSQVKVIPQQIKG